MTKGFTLIELLIVIAIIGTLSGILFVSVGQQPLQKARDAKRTSDLQNVRTALVLYFADSSSYPTDIISLVPTYIPTEPIDPRSSTVITAGIICTGFDPNVPSTDTTLDPGDFGYRYVQIGGGTGYTLQSCLEDANNSALDTDSVPTNGNIYDINS